jgi:hypothetical protein
MVTPKWKFQRWTAPALARGAYTRARPSAKVARSSGDMVAA